MGRGAWKATVNGLEVQWPSLHAPKIGILGSIPGSGRSAGEGNGNPLQYSCLENPMDRGALQIGRAHV